MAAKDYLTLVSDTTSTIFENNSKLITGTNHQALMLDLLDSVPNVVTGGNVFQSEVGYNTLLTLTDPKSFVHKQYVDNYISNLGSTHWSKNGNAFAATGVLGTTDNQDVQFRTNNTIRATIKNNGHWQFISSIYDGSDNLFIDIANKQLSVSAAMVDVANTTLSDSNGISVHWTNRTAHAVSGNINIKWSQAFTQINGASSDVDLVGMDGFDLRIAGDPNGAAGLGTYVKAYNTTGSWRTGIKYLNQALSYPDLFLQPDGGRIFTAGAIYKNGTSEPSIDPNARTLSNSNSLTTFGYENPQIFEGTGANRQVLDGVNMTLTVGSDVRFNWLNEVFFYQNNNIAYDLGNGTHYASDGSTKQMNHYNASYLSLREGGTGGVMIGSASAPTEMLQVVGNIAPEANGTRDLGTSSLGWLNLYMASNIHYQSDLLFKNATVQKIRFSTGGSIFINGGSSIDVEATGGSDVLNLGTSNADVINIGYSGSTINITGTLAYQNVTNLQVTDKLFTLNKGGGAASGVSTGFEIEENAIITGYFATNGTRDGWDFKAPSVSNYLTLSLASITATRTLTAPDVSGILATTNGGQTFSSATWNGSVISGQYGGTGVANTGKTITLGGNLTTTGAFDTTLAAQFTGTTTLPPVTTTLAGKTGTMAANYVGYWNDANQLTGSTNLTYDPSTATIVHSNTTTSFITVRHTNAGSTNKSQITLQNNSSVNLIIGMTSSTWTASARYPQAGAFIETGGTGGMVVSASNASGVIVFLVGGAASTDEMLRITNLGIYTSNSATLGLNTASVANQPITGSYTFNGTLSSQISNLSTGTSAINDFQIANSSGNAIRLLKYGTGYTTSGLLTASLNRIFSGSGNMMFGLTAGDFMWVYGGTAASNEILRLTSAGLGVSGQASTKITAPTALLHIAAGTTAAGTAPLKLTTQAAGLTSVEQGVFELIGNSLQFTQLAKRRGVAMSQSVRTSTFTLGNSTTESASVETAEHGANYLEVGKREEIFVAGIIEQSLPAASQLQVRIKYAGTTVVTLTTAVGAIAANTHFEIRVVTTCRTTGASGTLQVNALMWINGIGTHLSGQTLATIDTTTAQDTTITFQWTQASPNSTISVHQSRVLCIETNK